MRELQCKADRYHHEGISASPKIDNACHRRKYKNEQKKVFLEFSENLFASSCTIVSSNLSVFNPTFVNPIASKSALITSTATWITNEYIFKLKIRYTTLGDWINVSSLLYRRTSKQPMIDKKSDAKGAQKKKNIDIIYLEKRAHMMKKDQFKVKDVFGDILGKESFSPQQITKIQNFLAEIM